VARYSVNTTRRSSGFHACRRAALVDQGLEREQARVDLDLHGLAGDRGGVRAGVEARLDTGHSDGLHERGYAGELGPRRAPATGAARRRRCARRAAGGSLARRRPRCHRPPPHAHARLHRPWRAIGLLEALDEGEPALAEGPGPGQEALLQDLGGERRGRAVLRRGRAERRLESALEVADREVELPLLGAESEGRQSLDDALGEAGGLVDRGVAGVDLALEPTDDGLGDAAAILVAELGGAGEPDRVERLEQPREREGVSVVRGGGQEDPVLEPRGDLPQRPRDVGVRADRAAGARLWASSTMSRSQRRRPSSRGSATLRNCSSTSGCFK
jgi:hypothetical protein